ncbi:MAG: hypothetical protein ACTS8V_03440 [Arsenophonus sp. ER-QC15-MAG3]
MSTVKKHTNFDKKLILIIALGVPVKHYQRYLLPNNIIKFSMRYVKYSICNLL